jgi:TP901 family phage tail tape measure protein
MAGKTAIKLNFDAKEIQKLIREFQTFAKVAGAPEAEITKTLNALYKLQTKIERGSTISGAAFQSTLDKLFSTYKKISESFPKIDFSNSINEIKKLVDNLKDLKTQNQSLSSTITNAKTEKDKLKKEYDAISYKDYDKDKVFATPQKFNSYLARGQVDLQAVPEGASDKEKARIEKENALIAQKNKLSQKAVEINAAMAQKQKEILEKIEEQEKTIKDSNSALSKNNKSIEEGKQKLVELGKTAKVAFAAQVPTENLYKFTTGLEAAGQAAHVTGGSIIQLNDVVNTSHTSFGKLGKSLFSYQVLVRGLKTVLRSSINTIKEMDEAITNMAVVTGQSREELWGMTREFKEMGQQAGSTMTEMASLTTEYIRQGRAMSEAKTLAVETAKAAKIAGISVSDSIQYMTSAINGFNLAASEASRVSDIFARVAAVSATDYEQLAVALSKVSAQANQAGMSIEYTTALLAKGIETTQEAPESIGTALKTIIARFRELSDYGSTLEDGMNVNKVESALKAVGIELRNETGEFRNLTDVLNELGPKWDDLNTMQRQAIAQAAAGTRQQSRFLAIMQDWGRTMELVNEAQDSAGASAAQYAKYAEGLQAQITNLKTTWQEFTTKAVNSELVTGLLKNVNDTLNLISKWTNSGFLQVLIVGAAAIAGSMKMTEQAEIRRQKIAERNQAILKGSTLEQKLQTAQQQMTTEEFRAYAAEVIALEKQKIAARRLEIESEKIAEIRQAAKLRNEKKITIELEYQTKVKQGGKGAQLQAGKERAAALRQLDAEYKVEVSTIKNKYAEIEKSQIDMLNTFENSVKGIEKSYENSFGYKDSFITSLNSDYNNLFTNLINNIRMSSNSFKGFFKGIGKGFKDSKKQLTNFAKDLGKKGAMAAGVVVLSLIINEAIQDIKELSKSSQDYVNDISQNYGEIGSYQESNKTLEAAVNEYNQLSTKLYKTSEDLSRLAELENSFSSGEFGDDVKDVNSALLKIQQNEVKMQTEYSEILASNMLAAFKEGGDVLDKTQFATSLKQILKKGINIEVTDSKTQYASTYANKMAEQVDFSDIYNRISPEEQQATQSAKSGGFWSAVGISLAGAGAGALTGAALTSWSGPGALVGAIIGTVVGLVGGIVNAVNMVKESSAKETAKAYQRELNEVAKEITDFATNMSETANDSLMNQFEHFKKEIGKDYSKETIEAAKEAYGGFTRLFELNFDSSVFKKLQGTANSLSENAVMSILDTFGELDASSFKEVVNTWEELIAKNNGDASKTMGDLYLLLNGSTSSSDLGLNSNFNLEAIKDRQRAALQANVDASNQEYEAYMDLSANKQKKQAKAFGMTVEEYISYLMSQQQKSRDELENLDKAIKEAADMALQAISPYQSFNDLANGLIAMTSSMQGQTDFAQKLREGTATIEEINQAASAYSNILGSEEAKAALEAGDFDKLATLFASKDSILSNVEGIYNAIETTNNAIDYQLADAIAKLDSSAEDYDEQVKNLTETAEAQKAASEIFLKSQLEFNKNQIEALKLSVRQREIQQELNKELLSGYEKNIQLTKDQYNLLLEDYNSTKETMNGEVTLTNGSVKKMSQVYEEILSGVWTSYENIADEKMKAVLTNYIKTLDAMEEEMDAANENIINAEREYQDKVIEIQNEAMDAYKENLKKETDELKKQIDKRKEYYEDFFDLLEEEEETDDYETERTRLLNTISSLSTARDANSLARLKEAQAELAELEKEQRSNEREARKEATLDALDSLSEQVDEEYEKTVENNAAIWDAFQEKGDDVMLSMIKKWKMAVDGYDKMTEAERKQWDTDWATYVRSYDTVSSASDLTDSQIAELSKSGAISAANDTSSGLWNYDPTPTTEDNSEHNSLVIENLSLELPSVTDGETFVRDFPQLLLEVKRNSGQTINSKN